MTDISFEHFDLDVEQFYGRNVIHLLDECRIDLVNGVMIAFDSEV